MVNIQGAIGTVSFHTVQCGTVPTSTVLTQYLLLPFLWSLLAPIAETITPLLEYLIGIFICLLALLLVRSPIILLSSSPLIFQ